MLRHADAVHVVGMWGCSNPSYVPGLSVAGNVSRSVRSSGSPLGDSRFVSLPGLVIFVRAQSAKAPYFSRVGRPSEEPLPLMCCVVKDRGSVPHLRRIRRWRT